MLKALGDETRYAMYEELARSTAAALGPGARRARSASTPTPCASTSSACARSGLVDVEADPPRHRRPSPAPLLPRAPARPASGSTRPPTPCSPACSPRMAERIGADADDAADDRPGLGHRGRARAPGPAAACGALEAELDQLGFEPALEADGADDGAARIEFLHCPFRELAEAYPELVCNLHRGLCEGVVDAVGGGTVERVRDVVRPRAVPRDRGRRVP